MRFPRPLGAAAGAAIALASVAALLAACSQKGYATFTTNSPQLSISAVTVPDSVSADSVLPVVLTVIHPNCVVYDHMYTQRQDQVVNLAVFGRVSSDTSSGCAQTVTDDHTYNALPPFTGSGFIVQAHEPDGSIISKTVTVVGP